MLFRSDLICSSWTQRVKTSASGCLERRRGENERGREEWREARRGEGVAVWGGVAGQKKACGIRSFVWSRGEVMEM